ncbi:MAG: SDR family oxidoreductase [Silicimonas sp.]|nr:SDR family oxidoreductase [Silicimonas sp.]
MPVLVTGGASGIGAEIVRTFHGQGARVGFIDIQDDTARALIDECDGAPIYAHADITDIPALQAAMATITDQIGPIRTLVNNAGNDKREPVDDVTLDDWNRAQDINLRPQFFAAQAVREGMARAGGGAIINLSSIVWRIGDGGMVPYATAKAASLGLTTSLADAFGGDNIRVNAIEPGAVMTPRQRELWYPTDESVRALVDLQCLREVLAPADIARMVLFLASDDARRITKQSFTVDAGLY